MLSKLSISFIGILLFVIAITSSSSFSLAAVSTSYDPQLAWTALWYAKVSSCTDASAVSSWTCGPSCAHYPNFQLEGVYTNKSMDDLAFTGYDPDRNIIVASFQGSEDATEWITDADFKQVPAQQIFPSAPADAMIHEGFMHEWQSYSAGVLGGISSLISKHPNAEMILSVGHSLGGAVCLLSLLSLIEHFNSTGIPIRAYTFGEPRVGNPQFAAWAQEYGIPTLHKQFRVTHARDPVVHLPAMNFDGKKWLHIPQEIWYDNDGNTTYKLCTGNAVQGKEDPNCSDSILPIDPSDHTHYLGICTGCSCSSEELAKQRMKIAKLRKNPKWHKVVKMLMDDKNMNQH